jgi:hypothetical protein
MRVYIIRQLEFDENTGEAFVDKTKCFTESDPKLAHILYEIMKER